MLRACTQSLLLASYARRGSSPVYTARGPCERAMSSVHHPAVSAGSVQVWSELVYLTCRGALADGEPRCGAAVGAAGGAVAHGVEGLRG